MTEDEDALSDLEDDDEFLIAKSGSNLLQQLRKELEEERRARQAAETARYELQTSFSRVKSFAFEAVRQRDEAVRLKEEAENDKYQLEQSLVEALQRSQEAMAQKHHALRSSEAALQSRDDALRQRDDAFRQRDAALNLRDEISNAIHTKDGNRSDVEAATRLLVSSADRITSKVRSMKQFGSNLPRSTLYTGIAAVAYGFIKRSEEIIDELIRQKESTSQQLELRLKHTALKVSELEASVKLLENELLKKSTEISKYENLVEEKEERISEVEQMASDKLIAAEKETLMLTDNLQAANSKLENIKASVKELPGLISQVHGILATHITPVHGASKLDNISSVWSAEDEPEDCIHKCIDKLKDVVNMSLQLVVTWKEQLDLRKQALDDAEGTITRLIVEKKEITNFLESALSMKQEMLDAVSKLSVGDTHNLNTINKNKETGNNNISLPKVDVFPLSDEIEASETINMVQSTTLGQQWKKSRQDIFQLQQLLAVARGEVELLRVTSERQAKELLEKTTKVVELEKMRNLAQESVDGLRTRLANAEQDALHWKQLATKETEIRSISCEELEKSQKQIAVLKERIFQLSNALDDSNSKLRLKEEMVSAATAARNAAEHSLQIADERALELRKRLDSMTRQFELLEGMDGAGVSTGWFKSCWPYKSVWGARNYLSSHHGGEIEKLLEPFV